MDHHPLPLRTALRSPFPPALAVGFVCPPICRQHRPHPLVPRPAYSATSVYEAEVPQHPPLLGQGRPAPCHPDCSWLRRPPTLHHRRHPSSRRGVAAPVPRGTGRQRFRPDCGCPPPSVRPPSPQTATFYAGALGGWVRLRNPGGQRPASPPTGQLQPPPLCCRPSVYRLSLIPSFPSSPSPLLLLCLSPASLPFSTSSVAS